MSGSSPHRSPRPRFSARLPLVLAVAFAGSLVMSSGALAAPSHPTVTTIECTQAAVVTKPSPCTVVVFDGSSSEKRTPHALMELSSTGSGTFSGCLLTEVTRGRAECQTNYTASAIGSGTHVLTARYPGDEEGEPSLDPSEASTSIKILLPDATTTTLSCVPTTVAPGEPAICTATVTDTTGTPQFSNVTGKVSFATTAPGKFSAPSCTLSSIGSGKARCHVIYTPTTPGVGPHVINATYAGDDTHVESQAKGFGIKVPNTATTLSCSPEREVIGQASTCTASVRDLSAAPTTPAGLVEFSSNAKGTFSEPTCTLEFSSVGTAGCQVSYTPTSANPSFHTLTASFQGFPPHEPSQGSTRLFVLNGKIRFAAPGGTGAVPCADPAKPCSLFTAADKSSLGLESGTEVIMAPGTYSGAGDLGSELFVDVPSGVYLHGTAGKPRPLISQNKPSAQAALILRDDLVSHLEVNSNGQRALLVEVASTAEDVIARATAGHSVACDLREGILRGSVCLDSGSEATALGTAITKDGSVFGAKLRNVTAVANGGASFGLRYELKSSAEPATEVVDALSVIARGTAKDVVARGLSSSGSPASGAVVEIRLRNSDFQSVAAETDASDGVATVTPAGANANITDPPVLAGDNVHQLVQSPTVDTGAIDLLSGASDIDGQARTLGPNPDIGADELAPASVTTVSCVPGSVPAGTASTCTATVEDPASSSPPHGTVEFKSNGAGSFSAGVCTLVVSGSNKASCQVTYTPSEVGTGVHKITAAYSGADHEPSEGSTTVTVVSPLHTTVTAIVCPATVEVGKAAECTATVEDKAPSGATVPTGSVNFHTADQGSFSPQNCLLKSNGDGRSASCESKVSYTPTAVGTGTHKLEATYSADPTHAASTGSTPIAVTTAVPPKDTTATAIVCPATVEVGKAAECTATVEDKAPSGATVPTGSVNFHTADQGSFSPQNCLLKSNGDGRSASCESKVSYTPTAVGTGTHKLEATYSADPTHAASTGSTPIAVTTAVPPKDTTATAIVCPATVEVGKAAECTATVEDKAPSGATVPTGSVNFHTADQGSFSPQNCLLKSNGDGKSASCESKVSYTPTAVGTGTHKLEATYSADPTHAASTGSTPIAVTTAVPPKDTTATAIVCPATVEVGKAAECTATVEDKAPSGATVPTGSVNFHTADQGSFSPQNCLLKSNGDGRSASCESKVSYTPTAVGTGTHKLEATYSADPTHAASTGSTPIAVTTAVPPKDTTATAIVCPATVEVGKAAECTATVEDKAPSGATVPTGSVNFHTADQGSFSPQNCLLKSNGDGRSASCESKVSYTPTAVGTGTHKLEATYSADPTHAASTGSTPIAVTTAVPPKDTTATAIVCPATVEVGKAAECTATVEDKAPSGATVPTGSVNFHTADQGSFSPQNCLLKSNGDGRSASCESKVSYTPTAVGTGTHKLEATYSADPTHAASTGSTPIAVTTAVPPKDTTATAIVCEPATVILGGAAACTVTVTDTAPSPSAPGGEVKFEHLGNGEFSHSANCTLFASGAAKSRCQIIYTPSSVGTGNHQITALYQGSASHQASQGSTPLEVVGPNGGHQTTTALNCEPSSVILGGISICTVNVEDTAANPSAPTGNVVFASDGPGNFNKNTCALFAVGSGKSRCQIIYTPAQVGTGTHKATALYPGDGAHEPSQASKLINVSAPNGGHKTTTALSCQPATLATGKATTCTASVTDTDANPTQPTRSVVFGSDSPGVFGPQSCSLSPAGPNKASCQVTYTPSAIGTHKVTAAYEGDPTHEPGQGETQLTAILAHQSKTALNCAPSALFTGEPSACAVTVTDESASPSTPTGSVSFSHSNQGAFNPAASCELSPAGDGKSASCQLNYTPSAAGAHQITAAYPGDAIHAAGEETKTLTVTATVPKDTTATAIVCEPATVILGGAAACTVTVTDTAPSPSAPGGEVKFEHLGNGEFSHSANCTLFATGAAKSRCQIIYTPSSVGTGNHQITALYQGSASHQASQGSTPLEVVGPNGGHQTTTALNCEPSSVILGGISICTVNVEDTAANPSAPTGNVVFASDGPGNFNKNTCALFAVGSGKSRCQIIYTPAQVGTGTHKATALYPGDGAHEPSQASKLINVSAPNGGHKTTTALSCQPATLATGKATTCTASVTDTDANPTQPTRSVVFGSDSPGVFGPQSCSLSPAGPNKASCQVTYTPSAIGTHKVTAAYEGDPTHEPGQGETQLTAILAHQSKTALNCAPSALFTGEPSACTVSVTDESTNPSTPTGSVSFSHSNQGAFNPAASCELSPAGDGKSASCQLNYTPSAAGAHQITAAYPGDAIHAAGEETKTLTVTATVPKDTTATTIVCEPATVILGGAAACTVTVTDTAPSPSAPGGEVTFQHVGAGAFANNGTCVLFTVGADKARCQLLYTPSAVGGQELTAAYQGDANHGKSQNTTALAVSPANGGHPTATSLTCEPSEVILGGVAICTAEVLDTAANNPSAPGGAVVFLSEGPGTFSTGGCILFSVGANRARCQLIYKPSETGPAPHKLTALYPGEAGHAPSQGSMLLNVVPPNGGHHTATTVKCEPATVAVGAGTACTATVKDTEATAPSTPHGGVIFGSNSAGTFDNGGCHLEEVSPGEASCQLTYSPVNVRGGTHQITAAYEGAPGQGGGPAHEPSLGTTQVTVVQPDSVPPHQTQAALLCAPANLLVGGQATCTVTVTDIAAAPTQPGGEARFASDGPGGFSNGAACALSNAGADRGTCQVSYTPSAVGPGVHRITVAYQGEANHLKSGGSTQLQVAPPAVNPVSPPNTIIRKKPRKKTARHKAKFKFVSDQPGSTFQCRIDKKPFRPCRSPRKIKKLKARRHIFRVRAVNPQGMVDPTPAIFRWKVGKVVRRTH